MNLKNIVIVLVHPDEPRNVGAACRAMANNDISELRIVGKLEDYDQQKVETLALHALPIWKNTKFFNSITEATSDCTMVAGTTRRRGKKRKGKLLLPEEFAKIAGDLTGTGDGNGAKVAAVFGNERTGLTDEEILECTMGVTIPSSETFASLNLSHAVQIISYHLFRQESRISPGYTPLTLNRIDKTVNVISDSLKKIGFFKVTGQNDMELFWRGILSRCALSESEAAYIEKTFTKAAGLASKNQDPSQEK